MTVGYIIEFVGEEGGYQTEIIYSLLITMQRVKAMRANGIPCEYYLVNHNKQKEESK